MTDTADAPPPVNVRYVNRPEVVETFADSIHNLLFDGLSLRLELCVNRLEPHVPPAAPSADQVTAARLVLALPAALELMNRLKQLEGALLASGQLKHIHTIPPGKAN